MIRSLRPKVSDDQLLAQLQAGGADFERAASRLYARFMGYVHKFRKKYPTISEESLQDAYADSVDALIKKVIKGDFQQSKASLSTLLFQIFSNKCVDQLRRDTNHKSEWEKQLAEITPDLPVAAQSFLSNIMQEEAFAQISGLMDALPEGCKELILALDYWGYSPEEVAQNRGYKNAKTASQAKYKCMEKLRRMIAPKTKQ